MDYSRIKKRIAKHKNINPEKYVYLGEVLKRVRKEKQLTQEAVTKGICSVSYYSKVENNKMLPPEYVIEEIGERLEVDLLSHFSGNSQESILSKIIDAFFNNSLVDIEHLQSSTKDLKHALLDDLITLTGHMINKEYSASKELISKLEPLSNAMDVKASQYFIILAAISLFHRNKFHAALNLLMMTEKQLDMPIKLRALEQHYLSLSKQQLKFKMSSYKNYQKAVAIWNDFNYLEKLLELNLYRIYFLTYESNICAERVLSKYKPEYIFPQLSNFYLYIKALIAMHNHKYEFAIESIKKMNSEYKDQWFYKGQNIRYQLKDYQDDFNLQSIIEYFDNDHVISVAIQEKVRYILQTTDDKKTYHEYIKDVALPLAIEHENLHDIAHYTEQLVNYAIESSRYKEAISLVKKMERVNKKLQTITGF